MSCGWLGKYLTYCCSQTRGEHFEGSGGPEDDIAAAQRDRGGDDDRNVLPEGIIGQNARQPRQGKDLLKQGIDASRNNVGREPPGPGGSQFKGEDYYRPEDVPDSIAAEGYLPPDSVTQSSREAENPSS